MVNLALTYQKLCWHVCECVQTCVVVCRRVVAYVRVVCLFRTCV